MRRCDQLGPFNIGEQFEADRGIVLLNDGPVEGGAYVAQLGDQAPTPLLVLEIGRERCERPYEPGVKTRMRCGRRFSLARCCETLVRVLPNRDEHVVAPLFAEGLHGDQRFIDQRSKQVQRFPFVAFTGANGDGRIERPAVDENRKLSKECSSPLVEEIEAPVDGGAERLVTRKRALVAAGEHAEPFSEFLRELLRGEQFYPRRREFHG